ncbi:hypothetical protein C8Q74DRAFT_1435039 [Fomes fomentarius]|nr:hypothetical protein C8Q74DRAFT_1435039 [Fomes fomentarius]
MLVIGHWSGVHMECSPFFFSQFSLEPHPSELRVKHLGLRSGCSPVLIRAGFELARCSSAPRPSCEASRVAPDSTPVFVYGHPDRTARSRAMMEWMASGREPGARTRTDPAVSARTSAATHGQRDATKRRPEGDLGGEAWKTDPGRPTLGLARQASSSPWASRHAQAWLTANTLPSSATRGYSTSHVIDIFALSFANVTLRHGIRDLRQELRIGSLVDFGPILLVQVLTNW